LQLRAGALKLPIVTHLRGAVVRQRVNPQRPIVGYLRVGRAFTTDGGVGGSGVAGDIEVAGQTQAARAADACEQEKDERAERTAEAPRKRRSHQNLPAIPTRMNPAYTPTGVDLGVAMSKAAPVTAAHAPTIVETVETVASV